MLLFGSKARDDWLYSSDIDLILVSDDFRNMSFLERIGEISQLWDGDLSLEAICYTPEEFERKKAEIGIVGDAVKYGIDEVIPKLQESQNALCAFVSLWLVFCINSPQRHKGTKKLTSMA